MRSRLGTAIRAVSEDATTAALMGIDVNRAIVATFAIGAAMAGAAGVLFGLVFSQINFFSGFIPGIKAFTAAVLGGIGNIPGAMVGGMSWARSSPWARILFLEGLGVPSPNQLKDVIAFTMLVLGAHLPAAGPPGRATLEDAGMTARHDGDRAEVALVDAWRGVIFVGLVGGARGAVPLLVGIVPAHSASGRSSRDVITLGQTVLVVTASWRRLRRPHGAHRGPGRRGLAGGALAGLIGGAFLSALVLVGQRRRPARLPAQRLARPDGRPDIRQRSARERLLDPGRGRRWSWALLGALLRCCHAGCAASSSPTSAALAIAGLFAGLAAHADAHRPARTRRGRSSRRRA